MDREGRDASIGRSRAAYMRIKSFITLRPCPSIEITPEKKLAVERVEKVIRILESIEEGKNLLKKHTSVAVTDSNQGPAKTKEDSEKEIFKGLTRIVKQIKPYQNAEVLRSLMERANKKIRKIEKGFDIITRKRIWQVLQGEEKEWAKYFLHPRKKVMLYVEELQRYIEKRAIPECLEGKRKDGCFITQVRSMTEETYKEREALGIIDIVEEILTKGIKKHISVLCYNSLKSTDSADKRIVGVINIGDSYQKHHSTLTGRDHPDKDVMDILKRTCKLLFTDAESMYTRSNPNEQTLYDNSLCSILEIVKELDKSPKIFDGWAKKRQPILKALGDIALEKSKKIGKIEGYIFLANSMNLLKKAGLQSAHSKDELISLITAEIRKKFLRNIEKTDKKQNTVEENTSLLLKSIERFAAVAAKYILPSSYRKLIIPSMQKDIREIAEKYGRIDEISDKHLSSLANSLFKEKH